MPNHKRGRDRGKYYYEHDDREFPASSSSERRVSFQKSFKVNGREERRNRRGGWDEKLRNTFLLDSDDVDMNGPNQRNVSVSFTRVVPYSLNRGNFRGRGPRHPRSSPIPGGRRVLQESSSSWYKVQIPNGGKHERDYLINILHGFLRNDNFIAYGYKKSGEDVSFYTDEYPVAEQLMAADRKITLNDGHKLRVHVRPNVPFVEVDDKLKDKVKMVMSGRYNVASQALDLRKFHADPTFLGEDVFFPLNRPNLLTAVVKIICESIPELRAIDLSDNRISILDLLKPFVTKVPHIKVFHLANNRVRYMNQFDCLQGLPIEDLHIDGNPVCDKFKDQSVYIREVRKRFPKVIKLDGTDLPPPIVFDVEDETPLIPSRGSFLCDVNGGAVVRQFLEQYYTIFDSDSRQVLIDAYHENAQFSLVCPPGLSSYIQDSRNLMIVNSLDKKIRLLRQGRSTIIAFLGSLIKTQHDPASFAVDLLLFTPHLIHLSVSGVFRELARDKKQQIRSFSRVFIIVPAGSGFCIVNDMISIVHANADQVKEAFKLVPASSSAAIASPAAISSPPGMVPPIINQSPVISSPPGSLPVPGGVTVDPQQQMVATLAMQTGMNVAWSEKCLSERNWNFDDALFVFSELNKQGKIPSEAFVK